jgi:hypothetical protein
MASVAEGAVSAGTSSIGVLSLVAAACGGGFKGGGFEFPTLTTSSRILLAVTGIALIVFEQFRSGHWTLSSLAVRRLGGRALLLLAAASFLVFVWLALNRQVIADPRPLATSYCPVRSDSPSDRIASTYWILEGFKQEANGDGLDSDRNIYDQCVRRSGETATIYRVTHVWQGTDPAVLDSEGKLAVHETDFLLVPGTIVRIAGELSGPYVKNNIGQLLYYNVWAPIELPEHLTSLPASQ